MNILEIYVALLMEKQVQDLFGPIGETIFIRIHKCEEILDQIHPNAVKALEDKISDLQTLVEELCYSFKRNPQEVDVRNYLYAFWSEWGEYWGADHLEGLDDPYYREDPFAWRAADCNDYYNKATPDLRDLYDEISILFYNVMTDQIIPLVKDVSARHLKDEHAIYDRSVCWNWGLSTWVRRTC